MYEHFKNDFLLQIQNYFNKEDINKILNCLDITAIYTYTDESLIKYEHEKALFNFT